MDSTPDSRPSTDDPSSNPSSAPDVMNDASFATHTSAQDRAVEETDTCRICRGEATQEEPLFYPCKCSGSIKYVHQECLMEWLSHSQKKHCELCKTPFRFTKLYHPQMPTQLPTIVFCRRALIHVLGHLVTWCRAMLVAFVWLVTLPWVMRIVWRWIFYLCDAGWARDAYLRRPKDSRYILSVPVTSDGINNTTIRKIVSEAAANFTGASTSGVGEPAMYSFVKKLLFGISPYHLSPSGLHMKSNTTVNGTLIDIARHQESTLLSDVTFFKTFTASEAVNRIILDVLEGQIITLLVVAAFILIFLIREWVVQQQPMINMAALGADNAERARAGLGRNRGGAAEMQDNDDSSGGDDDDEDDDDDDDGYSDTSDSAASGSNNQAAPTADEHVVEQETNPVSEDRLHAFTKVWEVSETLPTDLRINLQEALKAGNRTRMAEIFLGFNDEQVEIYSDSIASIKPELRLLLNSRRDNEGLQNDIYPAYRKLVEKQASSNASGPSHSSSSREGRAKPGHRPNMPSRARSSIATGIHRNIEEGSSTTLHTPLDGGNAGNGTPSSSESWQDVSNVEEGSSSQFPEIPRSQETSTRPQAAVDGGWDSPEGSRGGTNSKLREDGTLEQRPTDDPQTLPDKTRPSPQEIGGDSARQDSGSDPAGREGHSKSGPDQDIPESQEPSEALSSTPNTGDTNPRVDTEDNREESSLAPSGQAQDVNQDITARTPPQEGLQRSLFARVCDWFWGDVAPADQSANEQGDNDEHVVQDLAEEAPFVPFGDHGGADDDDDDDEDDDADDDLDIDEQDPEVARAAAEAGIDLNDQDAIEDAEDLEGILELIGQQGPITGLFQNATFSVLLIGMTLTLAVGLPYVLGKAVLLLVGSPFSVFLKVPLRLLSGTADLFLDILLLLCSLFSYIVVQLVQALLVPLAAAGVLRKFLAFFPPFANRTLAFVEGSVDRISNIFIPHEIQGGDSSHLFQVDPLWLSTHSHIVLRNLQNHFVECLDFVSTEFGVFYHEVTNESGKAYLGQLLSRIGFTLQRSADTLATQGLRAAKLFWSTKKLTISLSLFDPSTFDDLTLLYWRTQDRISTVLLGYSFIALCGAIYLRKGSPISSSLHGRKIESVLTEVLQQAGGIFKVILIISIEMIAFPLYCGVLLDIALLPLFAEATLRSRYEFALGSPWTAGFVHWFVGTCYMFHFALFVSMCRKIMRKGVLYFIRDPDDPTFHPVRDVLERNVTTQLRKITFSAMVYGVLIIICLGGVVWTLDGSFTSVLPIRWATSQPALEFPLDLLFYNFLTPVVIRVLRPSDVLHAIYEWWFRTCASMLRLSDFLFGGNPKEEQTSRFRRTWKYWFGRLRGDSANAPAGSPCASDSASDPASSEVVSDNQPPVEGKFVRAPGSDQVRIPKGENVFIEVDQDNKRLDGKPETTGIHGRQSDMTTVVYIPPWFKVRISLFIASLWLFAAATGVGVTIIPLLFGRRIFSFVIPSDIEVNDIYAFSFGIYTLGGFAYALAHLRPFMSCMRDTTVQALRTTFVNGLSALNLHLVRASSILYVYGVLIFVFPILIASAMQLYILMPLHTYFEPKETHVVFLVQDWTLGFLYGRIVYRIFFADRNTRPGRVLQAVMRDGYTQPNPRLATRCFVLPLILLFGTAFIVPALCALLANATIFASESDHMKGVIFRHSYPAALGIVLAVWVARELLSATTRWRGHIKDEVYLIGERLHNFGEKRPGPPTARVAAAVEVAREGDRPL